jgi:hypothetical protein
MRERSFGEIASAFGSKAHLVDVNRAHAHDDSAQNSWHSSTFEGQICSRAWGISFHTCAQ